MTPAELRAQPATTVPVVVVDLEMTGLNIERDRVCEVAAVRAHGGVVERSLDTLVKPPVSMSDEAREITGITDESLVDAPTFGEIAGDLYDVLRDAVLVCHNVETDLAFLHLEYDSLDEALHAPISLDTLWMARRLFAFPRNALYAVAKKLGVTVDTSHRALADAEVTWRVLRRMLEILDPAGTMTVGELNDLIGALAPNSPLRLRQKRELRAAMHGNLTVILDYQDTKHPERGVLTREVGIRHIKFPYVQGWCFLREGERVFRLDRMRSVERTLRKVSLPHAEKRI